MPSRTAEHDNEHDKKGRTDKFQPPMGEGNQKQKAPRRNDERDRKELPRATKEGRREGSRRQKGAGGKETVAEAQRKDAAARIGMVA